MDPGSTPHQFTSEAQVLAAASGAHPEITLVSTDEVYRCSVRSELGCAIGQSLGR
jgi:hypothetical protein